MAKRLVSGSTLVYGYGCGSWLCLDFLQEVNPTVNRLTAKSVTLTFGLIMIYSVRKYVEEYEYSNILF